MQNDSFLRRILQEVIPLGAFLLNGLYIHLLFIQNPDILFLVAFSSELCIHTMRKWLSGRASPCQGEGRGFEPRLPLHYFMRP
jgi:hypothetical protein